MTPSKLPQHTGSHRWAGTIALLVSTAVIPVGDGRFNIGRASAQQEPTSRLLPDGVRVWERPLGASEKPWFFREMESALDLVLPSRARLPFEKSVAFLIGVSDYTSLQPQLPFVKNDLEDMREYLLSAGGFDAVYVAAGNVASQQLVEDYMLNRFRRELGQRDRLLFYFAGHGADLDGTTGYIQFGRAKPGDFAHDVLPIDRVYEWARVIKASHILFVFDACASGLAFSGRTPEDDAARLASTLSGGGSRIVLTAGTGDQETYEVETRAGRGNGVFTRALIDALQTSPDPLVTINGAFAGLETRVAIFAARYKRQLTPRIGALPDREHRGTFVFINPAASRKVLPGEYLQALNAKPRGASSVEDEPNQWPLIANESYDASSKWSTARLTGRFGTATVQLRNGVYRWETSIPPTGGSLYRAGPYEPLGDFYAAVDMRIDTTSDTAFSAGLEFRATANEGYEFRLTARGSYALAFQGVNSYRRLQDWTYLPSVRPAALNRLAVAALGDSIRLYVNGRLYGVIVDATRRFGWVGVIMGSHTIADSTRPPVRGYVEFDNFELRGPSTGADLQAPPLPQSRPKMAIAYTFPAPDSPYPAPQLPPALAADSDRVGRALTRALEAQAGYAALAPVVAVARSPAEAYAVGASLARRGLPLLPIEDQIRRLEVMDRLLGPLNATECVAFARGLVALGSRLPVMLDSTEVDLYANATVKSMVLAARNPSYVVPPLDQAAVFKLIDDVTAALPPAHQARFSAAMLNPPTQSSTDPCWAQRVLYAYGLQQTGERRTEVVTLITQMEASAPMAQQ